MTGESATDALFLGTGSAFAPGRAWNCILLDGRILLDAPPTAMPAMKAAGFDMKRLEAVFVTHPHGDHFLGLPFIFLEFRMRQVYPGTFRVACPSKMVEVIDRSDRMAYPGMADRYADRLEVEYQGLEAGDIGSLGDIRFRAFPMEHGGLPALGYVFDVRDRWIAYSGDTGPCEGLDRMVEESDVAIVEMAMTDGEYPGHMNLKNILELKSGPGRDTELWVTHLDVMEDATLETLEDAGIRIPGDGKTYRL